MNVITCKGSFDRYFGHFTIVLVDFDLSTKIRNKVWVEGKLHMRVCLFFVHVFIALVIIYPLISLM